MLRATSHAKGGSGGPIPFDIALLRHDERRFRRRLIALIHGDEVMVDLPETVSFEGGDRLVLDDGRHVEIIACEEALYEVRTADAGQLAELAWHLGNRHLPAQIEWFAEGGGRILIARDHVIRGMLTGLGAVVTEVSEPFFPLHGAYHGHDHALLSR